jgi:hypothetical protein
MKTIEIKLYKFEELSKEAQQTAIEKHRDSNNEFSDRADFISEDCNEQIKNAGFENPKVIFSLNYCQGDGLSFSADSYNKLEELFIKHLGKGKEKTAKLLVENCEIKITSNNGHHCYASKSDIDLSLDAYGSSINVTDTDRIDKVVGAVLEDLEDIYMNLCKELEKNGYEHIEYENSDEFIKEEIEGNEYDFTEDGKMY